MAFRKRRVEDMATATKNKSSFITTGQRAGNLRSSLLALSGLYSIGAATTPHSNTNWDGWLWKKNLICLPFSVTLHHHSLHFFFFWSASPVSKGFCVLSLRWMPEIKPTERQTASIRGTERPSTTASIKCTLCLCLVPSKKKKKNYHSAFNGVFMSNLCCCLCTKPS